MTVRDPSDGSVSSWFEDPNDPPLTEDEIRERAIAKMRYHLDLAAARKKLAEQPDGPEAA